MSKGGKKRVLVQRLHDEPRSRRTAWSSFHESDLKHKYSLNTHTQGVWITDLALMRSRYSNKEMEDVRARVAYGSCSFFPKWKILIISSSLGWVISTLERDMHYFFWATGQSQGPEDTKCLYRQDNSRSLSLLITRNPEVWELIWQQGQILTWSSWFASSGWSLFYWPLKFKLYYSSNNVTSLWYKVMPAENLHVALT